MRSLLLAALLAAIVAFAAIPTGGAHHLAGTSLSKSAGTMTCNPASATLSPHAFPGTTIPGLGTFDVDFIVHTDNGQLKLSAVGTNNNPTVACVFQVAFQPTFQVYGTNPQGSITNVASSACLADTFNPSCTTTASLDWYLACCPDPAAPSSTTPILKVFYDLMVNGAVVASGTVTIWEPSAPVDLPLP